jgi:hypothetical protein
MFSLITSTQNLLFDNFAPEYGTDKVFENVSQTYNTLGKVKLSRYRPWTGPWGSRRLRFLEFLDNRHMKVVRLSALCNVRLYPQEGFLVLVFVRG